MTRYGDWQQAGEGIRRRIYPPGQGIMSMALEFKAGSRGAAHAHPHEQITHVFSGRLEVTIEDTVHVIGPGEQLYVPGNMLHAVEALEDSSVLEVFTPLRDDLLATITER